MQVEPSDFLPEDHIVRYVKWIFTLHLLSVLLITLLPKKKKIVLCMGIGINFVERRQPYSANG